MMIVKVRRSLQLLILISCLVLVGCFHPKTNPLILDTLSDTEPACWLEICPGSTTRADAIAYLESQPDITITSQNPDHPVRPSVTWSASPSAEEVGVLSGTFYSDIADEMVTQIALRVDDRLSLEEVLAKLGPPPQIVAQEGGAEVRWLWLDMRYPDRGILVTHLNRRWQLQRSDSVTLKPGLRVGFVDLFASDRVETLGPGLIGAPGAYPWVAWPGWDSELEVVDLTE